MSELKLCSYCKSVPQANTWTLHGISETRYFCPNPDCPHSVRTVTLEEWNTRPIEDALNKRIAELEAAYEGLQYSVREMAVSLTKQQSRIAELEAAVKGHDPFEEFPPKERGFECSVMVLGKFEYEEEFTAFTNWDLCVYWFDEERWHPLNGYLKGDDIVRWYALPPEVQE